MLPYFAYGDAIGNQAIEIRRLLREWGYRSEIFAENWDRRLKQECRPYREYDRYSHSDNLLFVHYSTGAEVNQYAKGLNDQIVLYYHNITPADYIYWVNGELARQLVEARKQLTSWLGRARAIAASWYNAQELKALGFEVAGVVPYILPFESLDAGLKGKGASQILRHYADSGMTDWLYVGRLVPNKCIQHIIKSFYYYHTWINPASRLFLVGGSEGMEDYFVFLKNLVNALALAEAVIFAGHYGAAEGLAAFYQIADLYISMSEHEGFCIPLIEAMYYALPVMAFASTGVPITLNGAGVLLKRKEYPLVAEIAHEITTNHALRSGLLKAQDRRLADLAPSTARAQFHACLATLAQH